MLSIYKGIHIIYWIVGICCIIGGAVASYFFPDYVIEIISLMAIIICVTLIILIKVARNKFKNEVMSLLYDCRAQDYLNKVEALLGNRRAKWMRSTYSWLLALGYDVIGDYEAMRESCQNITVKSHMSEYHRRMCSYYVEMDQIDLANKEIESLKMLASKSGGADRAHLEQYIGECVRAVRIKLRDVEGMDQHFEGAMSKAEPVLLTRVSVAETYGQVLIFKGDLEQAKKQLLFASKYGGDTKYKKFADILLESIS